MIYDKVENMGLYFNKLTGFEKVEEEYNKFYKDMFYDYEEPLMHLHIQAEGLLEYKALLYIPKKCPEAFFSKYFERGLRLYSNGVLITEKNKELNLIYVVRHSLSRCTGVVFFVGYNYAF